VRSVTSLPTFNHISPELDEAVSMPARRIWVDSNVLPVIPSGYWRNLWFSPDFANHSLKDCVNVIHIDIVDIWNLNDNTKVWFSLILGCSSC
jgi:hypothetical protein